MNIYLDRSPELFRLLEHIMLENSQHYSTAVHAHPELLAWIEDCIKSLGLKRIKAKVCAVLSGITAMPRCRHCGKSLADKDCVSVKRGFRQFCSRKCRASWDSEHWTADKHRKLSAAVRAGYAKLTDNERAVICEHRKASLAKLTSEQKLRKVESFKATMSQKTAAEIKAIHVKAGHTLKCRTVEQKMKSLQKLRDTLAKKSQADIDVKNNRISLKNKLAWQKKTETEKQKQRELRKAAAACRSVQTIADMVEKCNATKRQNNSFNTSKPEEDSYKLLCGKFGTENIIRQYKSEAYPFNCDFYIKPLDLYVECNYFWQHGGHWFNSADETDLMKLNSWKSRGGKCYAKAIYVWTCLDPRKRNAALSSNLNYKVFWSIEGFKNWIFGETHETA